MACGLDRHQLYLAHSELLPDRGTLYGASHWTRRCAETAEGLALNVLGTAPGRAAVELLLVFQRRLQRDTNQGRGGIDGVIIHQGASLHGAPPPRGGQ